MKINPYPLFVIENFVSVDKSRMPKEMDINRDKTLYYKQVEQTWPEFDKAVRKFVFETLVPIIKPLEKEFFFDMPDNPEYSAIFMKANSGYKLLPHNDSRNRLVSGMLYLTCDKIVSGGELIFCDHENLPNLPHLMEGDCKIWKTITPKAGTFVCWLNSYNSYHYVNELQGERESIYISFSSRNKIWL